MDEILELDLIIDKKKYAKIYDFNYVLLMVLLIFIYVIFTYQYQSYYFTKGKMLHNELILLVNINDLKYLEGNNVISIDNVNYTYRLTAIEPELYVDENYDNYQYVHLKIDNLTNIDNYVYEVKIPKEKQILAKYLKRYL